MSDSSLFSFLFFSSFHRVCWLSFYTWSTIHDFIISNLIMVSWFSLNPFFVWVISTSSKASWFLFSSSFVNYIEFLTEFTWYSSICIASKWGQRMKVSYLLALMVPFLKPFLRCCHCIFSPSLMTMAKSYSCWYMLNPIWKMSISIRLSVGMLVL